MTDLKITATRKQEPTVSELMKRWREATGYNAASAGEVLGMSGRTIENIEQGIRRVDDKVLRIALESLIEKA